MTKSKKLISMLLAFVMLLTSCSVSFFAFAADSAENIAAANAAAVDAIKNMTGVTATTAKDNTFLTALNALDDPTNLKPEFYAYALQVAVIKVLNNDGKTGNNVKIADKAAYIKKLADGDAATVTKFNAVLTKGVPAEYLAVIKDFNTLNASDCTDTVVTSNSGKIRLLTDGNVNYLNFATNPTAKSILENVYSTEPTFNYTDKQIAFADAIAATKAQNGVTAQLTKANAQKLLSDAENGYDGFSTVYGDRFADRFANVYFVYLVAPVNANIVKAKYIASNNWKDAANGPTQYYNELKDFFTNPNTKVKAFYVNYLTALKASNDVFDGYENIGTVIDTGLKIVNGESVSEDEIETAYNIYNNLSDTAKYVLDKIVANVPNAYFNAEMSDVNMKANVKFGDGEETDSVNYLASHASTMSDATKLSGLKLSDLIDEINAAFDNFKDFNEFKTLVNTTVAKATITPTDVDAVWNKFKALKFDDRTKAKNDAALWKNVIKIMTSQFVQYVNAVDMNNVTDENRTQSTTLLNNTKVETVEEITYDFKNEITTSNDYKTVYEKYNQIQIDKFRKYVEGVDLDNVTAENRTQAKALYEALDDEFQAFVQKDNALYSKYLKILASEFKDYVAGIDLNTVDDAVRKEARDKYQALSEDAKKTAYEDAETWDKYCKIQTPDTDTDKHEAEAAKKADKVTYPTSDSEAIKALGKEKAIDNVEDFVIDDLLPALTDKVDVKDKKDVVNSALKQHLSGATVGKIYSLYASVSHNKDDIDPVKMPGIKVCDIIPLLFPADDLSKTLYEDSFVGARTKIHNAVASGQVPVDGDGNPVQVPCGTNPDGTTIYEDANIYDAIAAIEFTDEDFGITDNNRDQFEAALLAALRPITRLCSPNNGLNIYMLNVDFFNHVDKNTGEFTYGVYECAVKLLEALGVTGLPTNDEYRANFDAAYAAEMANSGNTLKADAIAGDQLLKPVIDGVFRLVDSELKTIPDLLALFPRLGDLVQSNIPETVYANLTRTLGAFSALLTNVEIGGQPLSVITKQGVLAPALLQLINDKLSGLGIKLKMPDWNALNKYTTFKVNKSAQLDKDYVAVRYIGGDDMFTEAVYYLYDNLFADKTNANALKDKIGGFPLVGKNIKTLIEKAEKAGKMKTYAAILDYFYDNGENPDATADAGKSIGDAIKGLNNTLNLKEIDASAATVKLSKRKYAYNGKIQKPSVKVTLDGEVLKKGIAYKVKYSKDKSKKIGAYKVTVKFIGAYKGADKTLKYTIGPKNARKIKLASKSGAFKIKYKKSKSKVVKGYVVEYSTSKNFKDSNKVKIAGRSTTSKTISGLKSGKKYYVRIKSYTVKGGKKIYSPFSNTKAVKVK